MSEEQTMILQMVQNGKLTADEAERLLKALGLNATRAPAPEPIRRGAELPRREEWGSGQRGGAKLAEPREARGHLSGAVLAGTNPPPQERAGAHPSVAH